MERRPDSAGLHDEKNESGANRMTRRNVREMLIFGRSCLYGMAGSLPSALLLVLVWIFAGCALVDAFSASGSDRVGTCVASAISLAATTSGCVGLCRALIPPWTTTRRSVVTTLVCLSGGLLAVSPFACVEIGDILQRREAHTVNGLDVIVLVFGGLALLYFVEACATWVRRRRLRRATA